MGHRISRWRLQRATKPLRRPTAAAAPGLGPFHLVPRAARRSGAPHDSGARGTLTLPHLATVPSPVRRRRPARTRPVRRRRISQLRRTPPPPGPGEAACLTGLLLASSAHRAALKRWLPGRPFPAENAVACARAANPLTTSPPARRSREIGESRDAPATLARPGPSHTISRPPAPVRC